MVSTFELRLCFSRHVLHVVTSHSINSNRGMLELNSLAELHINFTGRILHSQFIRCYPTVPLFLDHCTK